MFTEEYDGAPVRLSKEVRELVDKIRKGARTQVLSGIDATLRPYQQTGFEWMYANAHLGLGSVIADDMGLGKTLQVITLLEKYREAGGLEERKALVVNLGDYRGSRVLFLWAVPVTDRERLVIMDGGTEEVLAGLEDLGAVVLNINRPAVVM